MFTFQNFLELLTPTLPHATHIHIYGIKAKNNIKASNEVIGTQLLLPLIL